MNTVRKTLASAAVLCLLSACATTDETASIRPKDIEQDDRYVTLVEEKAKQSAENVDVVWVNPPDTRADEE